MIHLFEHNWAVRDQWFELCSRIPHEVLIGERVGGVGTILKTLFHIVDVELSWIEAIKGNPVIDPKYEEYSTLPLVRKLSESSRDQVKFFIASWSDAKEYEEVIIPWSKETFFAGEIVRHVIIHEIHHIGQLSVWAREAGVEPVSSNFIGNGFMKQNMKAADV